MIYQSRRDTLIEGLTAWAGTSVPRSGSMFVWAPIPEPYREMRSLEFSVCSSKKPTSPPVPGVGFGDGETSTCASP